MWDERRCSRGGDDLLVINPLRAFGTSQMQAADPARRPRSFCFILDEESKVISSLLSKAFSFKIKQYFLSIHIFFSFCFASEEVRKEDSPVAHGKDPDRNSFFPKDLWPTERNPARGREKYEDRSSREELYGTCQSPHSPSPAPLRGDVEPGEKGWQGFCFNLVLFLTI